MTSSTASPLRARSPIERDADLALLVAAIDAYEAERDVDQARFFASAHRGRPRTAPDVGRAVEFRHRGQGYRVHVTRPGPNTYDVELDGATAVIRLEPLGPFERRLHMGSRSARIVSAVQGDEHLVEVDGTPHRFRRDDQGIVRSPIPGVVVAVPVSAGHDVRAGVPVAVIESMKMETAVPAPFAGRVRCVLAGPNEQVDSGAALVQLDTTAPDPDAGHPAARLTVPASAAPDDTDARERCRRDLALLRGLMLGYDIEATRASGIEADLAAVWRSIGPDPELVAAEQDVLVTFADLRVLFREVRDEADADVQVRAPQEHLHAYLRSLDVEGEGLPSPFLDALRRGLGHYGVDNLERTPELEEALYWIHQSQQRVGAELPIVTDILERWLEQGPQGDTIDDGRRRTLRRPGRGHPAPPPGRRRPGPRGSLRHRRRTAATRHPRRYVRGDGGAPGRPRGRPSGPRTRRSHGRPGRLPATTRSAAATALGGRSVRPRVLSCWRR